MDVDILMRNFYRYMVMVEEVIRLTMSLETHGKYRGDINYGGGW